MGGYERYPFDSDAWRYPVPTQKASVMLLTPRALIASMALQGLLSGGFDIHEPVSEIAVKLADDLIAELEK